MTLAYLASEGSLGSTAALFEVSKSTAIANVNEIFDMLQALSSVFISFPTTFEAWQQLSNEFEAICGFPEVAGAVDGSLFRIERSYEYEGWISRKGWAAINMQATVDRTGRFLEYSLRNGSCSEKNLWTMSSLGSSVNSIIPPTMHLLGDAGYTLSTKLITPYTIYDGMPKSEKRFNKIHSRTSNPVECAFGALKGRWRILKRTLNMKNPSSCARTIVACMVLHNLTLDANDDVELETFVDPYLHLNIPHSIECETTFTDRISKRNIIKDYLNLF
ncbi:hypothetical protein Ae201684P_010138 [Aphanomyces euteiches]|uniref:DDE Tnp4 domain-containing protein n=1 Tax=Aphanomyces euteiches TaxID=100861 RepID=A0A6G0X002_9STRA|nr:hypothetical protein Ae201684_009913 [Aphanomyces euteiches]KAH9095929.1 hypothetical protein Ae201684P_010138 [Aphanomyces euteiches]